MAEVTPDADVPRRRRRLWLWGGLLLALGVLSLIWTLTPARDWIDPDRLIGTLTDLGQHPAAPWLVMAGFVVGGLIALPVTLMVVTSILVLGPLSGFACALAGATLSAIVAFGAGRMLGHRALARMQGSRAYGLSLRLRDAGIIVIAALRMVPVAHFTMISLGAGATHIRLRDFTAGTVLGMAPGIGLIALFFDRVLAVNARPEPAQYLLLAVVSIGLLSLLLGLRLFARHLVRSKSSKRRSPP